MLTAAEPVLSIIVFQQIFNMCANNFIVIVLTTTAGSYLLSKLRTMETNHENIISNARGKGLFCAFDLETTESRDKLISNMGKEGAIILGCGHRSIRFRPHLNISKDDIDIAFAMLENSIHKL